MIPTAPITAAHLTEGQFRDRVAETDAPFGVTTRTWKPGLHPTLKTKITVRIDKDGYLLWIGMTRATPEVRVQPWPPASVSAASTG